MAEIAMLGLLWLGDAADGMNDIDQPGWTSPVGRPDWYDHEHRAVGPAGTVIAYRIDTIHRGTNLFHDSSRPGRRRWCATGRCGNKVNTKAYRQR